MTELEALRRVAEAARAWIDGKAENASHNMARMMAALLRLDEITIVEPEGETVKVAAGADRNGDVVWNAVGSKNDRPTQEWRRIGVMRLTATVEHDK